jgi:uncharacterized protein (DUF1800 family)
MLAVGYSTGGMAAREVVPNDERAVTHALNRLAFGPRPGEVARVTEMGLGTWIDRQLHPGQVPDPGIAAHLERLTTLTMDARTLARDIVGPARQERRRLLQQAGQASAAGSPEMRGGPPVPDADRPEAGRDRDPAMRTDTARRARQVFTDLGEAKLLRAVYSERQLEEVLVDFWFNHFNVFARKGRTEVHVGEYEREAIRPHVLGSFRDLLGATAKSPAMLFYLDNWISADPDASGQDAPQRGRLVRRPLLDTLRNRARGLNENYARELLELHTLGVDGGYTQQDVVEVARAFTGWTIGRPDEGGFRFVAAMHDRDAKRVLGHAISAGGGIEDGERVLDLLAAHPSTARHIAFKLAQRFVSDVPPTAVVDRAASVFRDTRGNLREVVRAVVTSSEFFAPEAHRAKVKTPFEFVVSALRAASADVRTALPAIRALADLGMPPYLCQPPTGYDETADTWVSSGALVNRMNFAVALSGGGLRGITVPGLDGGTAEAMRARIIRDALADDVSEATRSTIARATTAKQALALTIGSPEFQRQ